MIHDNEVITEDILIKFGFEILEKNKYRLKIEGYFHDLDVCINPEYNEDNINCGYLMIHREKCDVGGIPDDSKEKEIWTDEDTIRTNNYIECVIPDESIAIAWGLKYVGRFKSLIYGLTGIELKEINE